SETRDHTFTEAARCSGIRPPRAFIAVRGDGTIALCPRPIALCPRPLLPPDRAGGGGRRRRSRGRGRGCTRPLTPVPGVRTCNGSTVRSSARWGAAGAEAGANGGLLG